MLVSTSITLRLSILVAVVEIAVRAIVAMADPDMATLDHPANQLGQYLNESRHCGAFPMYQPTAATADKPLANRVAADAVAAFAAKDLCQRTESWLVMVLLQVVAIAVKPMSPRA